MGTADFNGDGIVDASDLVAFTRAFEAGDISADFNGDGYVTGEDYDAFVEAYSADEGWSDIKFPSDVVEYRVENDAQLADAKSKLIDKAPAKLLLSRSCKFGSLGKFSAGTNLYIGAYGEGYDPIVECEPDQDGIYWEGGGGSPAEFSNLSIVGICFSSGRTSKDAATSPSGIKYIRGGSNILIEGCTFQGFSDNINIQGPAASPIQNVRIRRCQILDSFGSPQHSQGLYAENIKGLLIEENVFDHNGWTSDADRTIFNHNMYLRQGVTGVVVRRNVIANPSATGVSMNLDGVIENNLILNAPVGINARTMGVVVSGNVIEGGANIGTLPRGIGVWCLPTAADFPGDPGPLTVVNNIIHCKGAGVGSEPAIRVSTQSDAVQTSVVLSNNITYRWPSGGLGGISVEAPAKGVKDLLVLAANQDRAEQTADVDWPEPGATVEWDWLEKARRNTRTSWNSKYTAKKAIDNARWGYGR